MKTITKIFICLLALCMLLPFVASCNKKGGGSHKIPAPGGNQQGSFDDDEETTDPDAHIEKPEIVDMGGYTYKAYVRTSAGSDTLEDQMAHGNNRYQCIDFWIDEANSEQDAISYAVYSRNSRIEGDYNCKIRQFASNGSQLEHLTAAYANGDGYDLTIMSAKPAAQAATRNLLRNLKDMKNVNLAHPSFDQNSINELSVADKLYFLSGDMNVSTLEVAGLSLVNMEFYANLAESIVDDLFQGDKDYSNIYNLVRQKKWTMDTMMKIATLANIDEDKSDGDLSVIDKGDTIGYHQYFYSAIWYFYSSGGRITTKNDQGIPELTLQTPRNQTLADYIYEHLNHVVKVPWIPHAASAVLNDNFLTGQVLFMDCSLFEVRVEIYPRAEFEYGILPCPLYEEGGDYHSLVYFNNWAHLWAIPSMTFDSVKAELMLQIMAVYSSLKDSTMYAYYDRTIYLKIAPDNNSRAVMDTIRQSMVYDIALLYDWGGLEKMLEKLATETSNPYGAAVSGAETTIKPRIEDTVNKLRNPTFVE